jgi:hypothetical protein
MFEGTADFDPGAISLEFTSAGGEDIFLQKLSPSGNVLWAKAIGGPNNDVANDIVVDGEQNVYATGRFEGTVDFDPNEGTFEVASAESQFGPTTNMFILKLRSVGSAMPRIQSHPSSGFIQEGDRLVLTAPAGSDFGWTKNGGPVTDDPPRVTGSGTGMLVFEPVQQSDAGVYTVTYDDGQKAIVESPPFTLSVLPPGSLPAVQIFGLAALALGIAAVALRRKVLQG